VQETIVTHVLKIFQGEVAQAIGFAQLQNLVLQVPDICAKAVGHLGNPTSENLDSLEKLLVNHNLDDYRESWKIDSWWLDERGGADLPCSVSRLPFPNSRRLTSDQLRENKERREQMLERLKITREYLELCARETMNQYQNHGSDLAELSEALYTFRGAMAKFADGGTEPGAEQ